MLYKYLFYKVYEYISKWFDPFVPQVTTTIALSLSPLSIIYLVLYLMNSLGVLKFSLGKTTEFGFIFFIAFFILLLIINQLYFFAFINWQDIIIYFRKNKTSKKTKIFVNIYLIISLTIYSFALLFLGYNF